MFRTVLAAMFIAALLLAPALAGRPAATEAATSPSFGLIFKGVSAAVASNALTKLGITWWFDFDDTGAVVPGTNKVESVSLSSGLARADVVARASRNPGAYWIIGNEPNTPGQDLNPRKGINGPADAASRYKIYTDLIKDVDHNAKLVAGNMLNWDSTCGVPDCITPGHQWMDGFLAAYQALSGGNLPQPDVWGIHTYFIDWGNVPMVDWLKARDDLQAFRSYLNGKGYSATPIWVTEFGVIYAYANPRLGSPDGTCRDITPCSQPSGLYDQTAVNGYLNGFVGWLKTTGPSLRIDKWFLYVAYSDPEPYMTVYSGIAAMTTAGGDPNLSISGEVNRLLAQAADPTPVPTAPPTSGGGGGGGGGSPAPVPTVAPTPAPTATPVPAPVPTGTTKATVGSGPQSIDVGGGTGTAGGVTIVFPSNTLSQNSDFTFGMDGNAPPGVTAPSGSILLGRTIDIRGAPGVTLQRLVSIRVQVLREELGGRPLTSVRGGVVNGATLEPKPTRVIDQNSNIIGFDVDHFSQFGLFVTTTAGPTLVSPASGVVLSGLGTTLAWSNPFGALQYQLQVVPFNNDGPGINLIRNAEESFAISAPSFGSADANYVMLPDMTYTWRVRTTASTAAQPDESDWSAWSVGAFHTASVSSSTISVTNPPDGGDATSVTPRLQWANSDPTVFYYEFQLSKDAGFGPNAFLYFELRHGGASFPPNSYAVPGQFPLEHQTTYYWRLRPRVQGDGVPPAWSKVATFRVP